MDEHGRVGRGGAAGSRCRVDRDAGRGGRAGRGAAPGFGRAAAVGRRARVAAPDTDGREDRGEGRPAVPARSSLPARRDGVPRARARVRVAAPRALPHRRASTSHASSACRRCSSCRPRTCGKRSSGARAAPAGGAWPNGAGEAPALRAADVVACGTEVVAEQARRIGARPESILITPTGVDLDVFALGPDADDVRTAVRERLGLRGRFVVGWVGSFRPFHALDQAIAALAGIEDATLLLIGDGPERARIEDLARAPGRRHGVHGHRLAPGPPGAPRGDGCRARARRARIRRSTTRR